MIKTKNLILLMAVIAMTVVFTAPAAMAVWPEPPPIYTGPPMTATITMPKGGTYTITAEVGPSTVESIPGDQYTLSFSHDSGSISGINVVYLTTPRWLGNPKFKPTASAYCSESLSVLYTSDDWQRNQNTDVLWETKGRDTMQWTAMSPEGIWFLIANKIDEEDLVPGTICIGEGRYTECAAIPVIGCPRPDCDEPLAGGVVASVQTCVNNYGKDEDPNDTVHYWFFRKNDRLACIDPDEDFEICTGPCPRTYAAESGDCKVLPAAVSSKHIVASGLQGQKCDDEATNTTYGNSPFYHYETWSGGYYYEACYDYAVPGWVNPSYCP